LQTADQSDISITPAAGKDNLPPKSALKQVLIVNDDLAMLEWQEFNQGLKEYSPPFPEPRGDSALVSLFLNTSCRLDQYSSGCLDRARKKRLCLQRQNKAETIRQ
jgi:hypothetical protein